MLKKQEAPILIITIHKKACPVIHNKISFLVVILLIISAALFAGCEERELTSKWRDRDIKIDGIDTEWDGARLFLDQHKVTVGIMNDEDYLYIRLSSRDRQLQMQMLRLGLTVWFDPRGKKSKTFGIHFPLGMVDKIIPVMRERGAPGDEKIMEMIEESQIEMEILGPDDNEVKRMFVTDAKEQGIGVMMSMSKANLVYEMKIPLVRNDQHPYAVGTDKTELIGLGFETTEIDREMMQKIRGEQRERAKTIDRNGGWMGRGNRDRNRRGGMSANARRLGSSGFLDPLHLWSKVKLSTGPLTAAE